MDREEIASLVTSIVQDQVNAANICQPPDVLPHEQLYGDCGLDSLDVIEIIARLEIGFDVSLPDQVLRAEATVNDLIALVEDAMREKETRKEAERTTAPWDDFPDYRK